MNSFFLIVSLLGSPFVQAQPNVPLARVQESGWLGVAFTETSLEDAKKCGYDAPLITITLVVDNSPAQKHGVRKGDVFAAVDGKRMSDKKSFVSYIREKKAGDTITLLRVCSSKSSEVAVVLGARPNQKEIQERILEKNTAPSFKYTDYETKKEVEYTPVQGEVVLLDFWATWCGPCLMSMPELKSLHERYAPQGLKIIGVTDESPSKIRSVARKYKLPYILASNSARDAFAKYRVSALPTAVLIDKKGNVHKVYVGAGQTHAIERKIQSLLKE